MSTPMSTVLTPPKLESRCVCWTETAALLAHQVAPLSLQFYDVPAHTGSRSVHIDILHHSDTVTDSIYSHRLRENVGATQPTTIRAQLECARTQVPIRRAPQSRRMFECVSRPIRLAGGDIC